MGDMNAHINLPSELKDDDCQYSTSKDSAERNLNSNQLINICLACNSKILNNCTYMNEKQFAGGYTYKKGARWMSELDHAVASKNILADVLGFDIVNTDLKSDHKPISTTLRIDESEYIMDQLLNKSDLFMSYEHLSKPTNQAKTERPQPTQLPPTRQWELLHRWK